MRLKSLLALAAFGLAASTAAGAHAGTVFVDAKDDIFLAGQSSVPSGFPTQLAEPGDGAGLLPVSINVHAGEILHLSATGTANCGVGCNPAGSGPGGDPEFGTSSIAGYGNVGPYTGSPGEGFQLLGVFNAGSTWSPFIIGAGGTFVAPSGATKLYLGLPDGFSFQGPPGAYNDNTGGFTVSVPEPSTWAMLILGMSLIGFSARRRRLVATPAV